MSKREREETAGSGYHSPAKGKHVSEPTQEEWYYASGGQQYGPVMLQTLRDLVRSGQVRATDLVWTAGMPQWTAAQAVPHLGAFSVAATQPPSGYAPGIGQPPLSYYAPSPAYFEYAGFWLRFVAAIIDALITGVGGAIAGGCVGGIIGMMIVGQGGATADVMFPARVAGNCLGIVVAWLYSAIMESSPRQATLGKMALGLIVTDENGERITFARASGRHFAKIISGLILLIGYMMAGWTERKQALHDMIAGTLVVRRRQP